MKLNECIMYKTDILQIIFLGYYDKVAAKSGLLEDTKFLSIALNVNKGVTCTFRPSITEYKSS